MRRSGEAFWWSLFAAGGALSAICVPILIAVTGFGLPFSRGSAADQHQRLLALVGWWPVRVALFVVISLTFFHCAHRIRHIFIDFGLRGAPALLAITCYAAALAGSVAAVVILAGL